MRRTRRVGARCGPNRRTARACPAGERHVRSRQRTNSTVRRVGCSAGRLAYRRAGGPRRIVARSRVAASNGVGSTPPPNTNAGGAWHCGADDGRPLGAAAVWRRRRISRRRPRTPPRSWRGLRREARCHSRLAPHAHTSSVRAARRGQRVGAALIDAARIVWNSRCGPSHRRAARSTLRRRHTTGPHARHARHIRGRAELHRATRRRLPRSPQRARVELVDQRVDRRLGFGHRQHTQPVIRSASAASTAVIASSSAIR